jgi:hypothetical protein
MIFELTKMDQIFKISDERNELNHDLVIAS